MRLPRIISTVLLLSCVVLVGTASALDRHGRLAGVLIVSGAKAGPHKCGCVREAGIVVVSGPHRKRRRIDVGQSGRFAITLPAGRYHAIGGIPKLGWKLGSCIVDTPAPAWITVVPGKTTRITVDCHGH